MHFYIRSKMSLYNTNDDRTNNSKTIKQYKGVKMTEKGKEVSYYGKKVYIVNPAIVRRKAPKANTPVYEDEDIQEHSVVTIIKSLRE